MITVDWKNLKKDLQKRRGFQWQKGKAGLLWINGTNKKEHRGQLETHHPLVGGRGTLLRFLKIPKLS